jgi:hypothetical protein
MKHHDHEQHQNVSYAPAVWPKGPGVPEDAANTSGEPFKVASASQGGMLQKLGVSADRER